MGKTSIEWTEFTANPLRARMRNHNRFRTGHYCEKVSRGCANCYASEMQPRFGMPRFETARQMDIETFLDPKVLLQVLHRQTPTQVFWCSMTDMFGHWVTNEMIAACFGVMAATPQHVHQVLTKRAERLPEWFAWAGYDPDGGPDFTSLLTCAVEASKAIYPDDVDKRDEFADTIIPKAMMVSDRAPVPWPLPGVHLGVSCEDQEQAEKRLPYLFKAPAAVYWASLEPLLGGIDLFGVDEDGQYGPGLKLKSVQHTTDYGTGVEYDVDAQAGLDWVVVGGESGRRARTCQLDWMRAIVKQCQAWEVPVLVKQLGRDPRDGEQLVQLTSRKGGDIDEFPKDLQVREYPRSAP